VDVLTADVTYGSVNSNSGVQSSTIVRAAACITTLWIALMIRLKILPAADNGRVAQVCPMILPSFIFHDQKKLTAVQKRYAVTSTSYGHNKWSRSH
jgi:hypothetical protein